MLERSVNKESIKKAGSSNEKMYCEMGNIINVRSSGFAEGWVCFPGEPTFGYGKGRYTGAASSLYRGYFPLFRVS
jgi:hypothetical protein